jgi:nicotinamide phosphoribosyltransferase
VLNNVRVIQGDGVNEHSIKEILDLAIAHGFSASNIAFGMGGALLQSHNRDTNKWAMKCSQVVINGKGVDVFKEPITDDGKKSKRGRLDLVYMDGAYRTVKLEHGEQHHERSAMRTVYENGELMVDDSLETIRKRSTEQ